MNEKLLTPIGYIVSDFKEKFGVPRQSGRIENVSKIIFYPPYYDISAFCGLENFNYIWILFDFSLTPKTKFSAKVRPPRLGGNVKVGVFGSRSPFRPNRIGLSSVKLLEVKEENGKAVLIVQGADLLDGTPVYDIKPYLPKADCHLDAVGGFSDDFYDYKLKVIFPEELLKIIPEQKRSALIGALSDDPRPSYHNNERLYGMKYDIFNVKFTVKDNVLTVTEVENNI